MQCGRRGHKGELLINSRGLIDSVDEESGHCIFGRGLK